MKKTTILILIILVAIAAGAAPALARGHLEVRGGIFIGPGWWDPWWGPPVYSYPYPYPYNYYYPAPPPVVQQQPPVYEEETPQPYYWYFCAASKTYYPYVKTCPGGWLKVVPPASPSPGKE